MFNFAQSVASFLFGIGSQAAFNVFPTTTQQRPSSGHVVNDIEENRPRTEIMSQAHLQLISSSPTNSAINNAFHQVSSSSTVSSGSSSPSFTSTKRTSKGSSPCLSSSSVGTSITPNSPPSHPRPWLWQCHRCYLHWPVGARRCVDELCGHTRCAQKSPVMRRAGKSFFTSAKKARYIVWTYEAEWAIPKWVEEYSHIPLYPRFGKERRQRKETQRQKRCSSTKAIVGDAVPEAKAGLHQQGNDRKNENNNVEVESDYTRALKHFKQADWSSIPFFSTLTNTTVTPPQPSSSSSLQKSSAKDICLDAISSVDLRFRVQQVHKIVTEARPDMATTIKECMEAVSNNSWKVDLAAMAIIQPHQPSISSTSILGADLPCRDPNEHKSIDMVSPEEQELENQLFLQRQEELCNEILHADDPDPEDEDQVEHTSQESVPLPGLLAIDTAILPQIDINDSLIESVDAPSAVGRTRNWIADMEEEVGILSQEDYATVVNKIYASRANRIADEELQRAIHISMGDVVPASSSRTPRKPTPESIARDYQELYGDEATAISGSSNSSSSSRESSPDTNPEEVAAAYESLWGSKSSSASVSRESTPESVPDSPHEASPRVSTLNSVLETPPARQELAIVEDFLRSEDTATSQITAKASNNRPDFQVSQRRPPSLCHQEFLKQQRAMLIDKCKQEKYKIPTSPSNQPEITSASRKRKFTESNLPQEPESRIDITASNRRPVTQVHQRRPPSPQHQEHLSKQRAMIIEECKRKKSKIPTYPTNELEIISPSKKRKRIEDILPQEPKVLTTTATTTAAGACNASGACQSAPSNPPDLNSLPMPNATPSEQTTSSPSSTPQATRKRKKLEPRLCGEHFDYDGWSDYGDYRRAEKRRRMEYTVDKEMEEQEIWSQRFNKLFSENGDSFDGPIPSPEDVMNGTYSNNIHASTAATAAPTASSEDSTIRTQDLNSPKVIKSAPSLLKAREEHLRKRPRMTDWTHEFDHDCLMHCDYPGQCRRKERSVIKEKEHHDKIAETPYWHWKVLGKNGKWGWHKNE